MVFITAFWKRHSDFWRAHLFVFGLMLALAASAAEIEILNPELSIVEDGYAVSADFNIEFNQRLEEVVTKGVPLNFLIEFELTRPRWYWLDEKLVTRTLTYRLSYHALTRQYRLSTGALHQSFGSLSEALRMLSRLRNWVVIEKSADKIEKNSLRAGDSYQAGLRLRLDITQLPKPFQISAFANKDWNLTSDWRFWQTTLLVESK